ncbi:PLDc N-terminal domain-containing protein [Pontibacter toksunensis]|uniref:PLDc N-terminal domain-containing protein n=1 Tax=Pontibacter toksunensis TaxID=1332631 RepID=A0ABW6BWP4_9BACT
MSNLLLFLGGFGGIELLLPLLGLFLLWLYAVVEIVTGTFQNNIDKLVWLLLVLVVPLVGVFLYFLIGRRRRLAR